MIWLVAWELAIVWSVWQAANRQVTFVPAAIAIVIFSSLGCLLGVIADIWNKGAE